ILDTGLVPDHPDLQSNLWANPVDGTHGFDCDTGQPGGVDLGNGHGTHVAGIAGATGNNGLGIAGVNWQIQLLFMRFLDATGHGNDADAISCMYKMLDLKDQGVNIRVVNDSWGGGGGSLIMRDAFKALYDHDIVSAVAAGNFSSSSDQNPG